MGAADVLPADVRPGDELPGSVWEDFVDGRELASFSVSFSARFSVLSVSLLESEAALVCSLESSDFLL
ncbi:MAG: hypothetical protein V3V71_15885, partial [Roseateles sp.]